MAKLDAKERGDLPASDFAGPNRTYPDQDRSHGENALARVSQNGTSELKKRVTEAVHKKYPNMGKD